MQSQTNSNGIFASFYFHPGEPDELLFEFMSLTGPSDGYHALDLESFVCKDKKPIYAIGRGEAEDGDLEVFGPLPYLIIKKHGIEALKRNLIGELAFLDLREINHYSPIAESAMRRVFFDTEEKVQKYLKTINTKSIPILNVKLV